MGVSIEDYRQRIGCFIQVLLSFKVRGNNNTTYQKQSKDFGTALRVIIRCVDYAIKISTIVIINTGYNNHAGQLYILIQLSIASLALAKMIKIWNTTLSNTLLLGNFFFKFSISLFLFQFTQTEKTISKKCLLKTSVVSMETSICDQPYELVNVRIITLF